MNEDLTTISQRHREQRRTIALGARKMLISYIKSSEAKSIPAFKLNSIMISKNRLTNPKKLRSAPCVMNGAYRNSKSTAFTIIACLDDKAKRKRTQDGEYFNDALLSVVFYDYTGNTTVSITSHAIQRAFERAWWYFKDKPVEEWVDIFMRSASLVWNNMDSDNINPSDHSFKVQGDILDTVCQLSGNSVIVLTYTPSTGHTNHG